MAAPERAEPAIARLARAELAEAASLLALAFRDNPLNRAVIGDARPERRLRCNRHGMRALLPSALAHGLVLAARGPAGLRAVLVSSPPFAYPLPPPPLWTRLRCALGQGLQVAQRWAQVFEVLDAEHPREPHWYLGALAVHPDQQGRGLGSALLAHWLGLAGEERPFHYLETDREQNLRFYGRQGFEVAGELQILGARVWRMRRGR